MKECFEKSFFDFLYYSCLQKYQAPDTVYKLITFAPKIKHLISALQHHAKEESIQDKPLIDAVNLVVATEDLEQIIESFFKAAEYLIAFSFQDLFSLVNEIDKSGEKMREKKIIMLLGTTGSGKSTTIHYLAGSKMEVVRVNNIRHIKPTLIFNEDLNKVICSWKAKSETRFVTPIVINHGINEVTLADTPGSEDTQSSEIEFANILGVQRAIGQAKSVRPVILFSFKNVGDRLQNLKENIHYYGSLFNKLTTYVKLSFNYVFTNVTKENQGSIYPQLLNIHRHLTVREQNDKALTTMLFDMIDKAEKNLIIEINPLDPSARDAILDQIIKSEEIPYPDEVIRPNVSKSSFQKMNVQLNLHYKAIKRALINIRADIIQFKLDELRKLKDIFPETDSYKNHYEECVKEVQTFINQKYETSKQRIIECMKVSEKLTQEDVKKYHETYTLMKNFDQIIEIYLKDTNTNQSADYVAALNEIIGKLLSDIVSSRAKVCDKSWYNLIKKLEHFSIFENLKLKQKDVIEKFMQEVNNQADKCIQKLSMNDQEIGKQIVMLNKEDQYSMIDDSNLDVHSSFSDSSLFENLTMEFEFAHILTNISKSQERIAKISPDCSQKIMKTIKNIYEKFEQFIKEIIEMAFSELKPAKFNSVSPVNFSEHQIKKGQQIIECLTQFKNAFQNYKNKECDTILSNYTKELQRDLEETMDKYIEYIQDFIKKLDKPAVLKSMYDNLELLKKLQLLSTQKTDLKFYQLINSISTYVRSQDEAIEKMFEQIQQESRKRDYAHLLKLKKSLQIVKALSWFSNYNKQGYQDAIGNIEYTFQSYIDQLTREIKGKKYGLYDIDNLNALVLAQKEIDEYKQILEILSDKQKDESKEREQVQDYQISIQQTIRINEEKLNIFEKQEAPLQINQLKFLLDYFKFVEIVCQNHQIFGQSDQNLQILIRIQGNDNALIEKQYTKIYSQLSQNVKFFKDYCQGNADSEEIPQNLEMLYTVLETISDVKQNYSETYKQISQNNLNTKIGLLLRGLLDFFIKQLDENEHSNQYKYKVAYEVLFKVTFVDQFTGKEDFKTQCESYKNRMQQNPTDNLETIKQWLNQSRYSDINAKLKQIEAVNNMKDLNNIVFFLREEVSAQIKIIQDSNKIHEKNVSIESIFNIAINLNNIQSTIDAKYLENLYIKRQIDLFIQRLKKQAKDYLQRSQSQKQSRNFAVAFKYLHYATMIKEGLINSSITEEKFQDIDESVKAETTFQTEYLHSEIESFATLDLKSFSQKKPIHFEQDLKELEHQGYLETYHLQNSFKTKLNENLQQKFKQIEKLQSDQNSLTSEIVKKLTKLEKVKDFIPQSLQEDFTYKLRTINESIQKRIEAESEMKKQIQRNNRIDAFIKKLEQNPKLIKGEDMIGWLNKSLKDQIQACNQQIKTIDTVSEGMLTIIEIEKYINHAQISQTLETRLVQDFTKLPKQITEYISQQVEELELQFSEQQKQPNQEGLQWGSKFNSPSIHQYAQIEQYNSQTPIVNISKIINGFKSALQSADIKKESVLHQLFKQLTDKLQLINNKASDCIKKLLQKIGQSIKKEKLIIDEVDLKKGLHQLQAIDNMLCNIRISKITEYLTIGLPKAYLESQKSLIQDNLSSIVELLDLIAKESETFELITEKTKQSGQDRKDHYTLLQNLLSSVKLLQTLGREITSFLPFDLRQLENTIDKRLQDKTAKLVQETKDLCKNVGEQNKTQMSDFQEKFSHLKSIGEVISNQKHEIESVLTSIEESINQKIDRISKSSVQDIDDINAFSHGLIKLQRANECYPNFREYTKQKISDILKQFKYQSRGDTKKLNLLAMKLLDSSEGANLVSEFKEFEGVERALFNERVKRIEIDQVLLQLKGDNIDKPVLKKRYSVFRKHYEEIVKETLKNSLAAKKIDTGPIISNIFALTDRSISQWTQRQADVLPELMALIFSLWTLSSAEHYFEADDSDKDKDNYLRQPHAAQVVSIFRILGIGYTQFNQQPTHLIHKIREVWNQWLGPNVKAVIADNLVQIKTGEGKSITLAVVSSIFALFGFEVRVACYSEYLSKRDFDSYKDFFAKLEIIDHIKYGTFNQACEAYINKDGNIRDIYLSKILKDYQFVKRLKSVNKPRVLMIDEVDVFFSKDFYGAIYRPQATIKHPTVVALIDYIWQNKSTPNLIQLASIKNSQQYKDCQEIFNPQYVPLLEEAVKDMICDVQDFHLHDYVEEQGKIGYKDQDQISFDISYGYKTLFAYYQKHSEGKVSDATLQNEKSIGINCGEFSYSEIPKNYTMILGVTGTLEQLSISERNIINSIYNILNFTYSPSVYGSSQLIWEPQEHIIIAKPERYYLEILTEITRKMKNFTRAVIVFFNNDKDIQLFIQSKEFKDQAFPSYKVLNERLNFQEKEDKIRMAARSGELTLATRSFGRGTDFICKDRALEDAGGVHVLLTFFSKEVSEEVQLMGRTARQGNLGSISMILLFDDLSEFDISEEDLVKYGRMQYYEMLKQHRNRLQQSFQKNETQALNDKIKAHNTATQTSSLAIMGGGNDDQIFKFLKEINLGRSKGKITKTLIMMDATGSMSSMITKSKNAVSTMFFEASKILTDKNINPKLFEIQFGCYRNYSSKREDLLQFSSWESNPQALSVFMNTITSKGGQGNEAVEIGLQHANEEANNQEQGGISQVFIIGDAPPNTQDEVKAKRSAAGEHWELTKYRDSTFYQWECKKLKEKGIPVYTFYVANSAKTVFEEIANTTGGSCQFLDVNSDNGQKMLVELFVEQILRKVGNENGGQGDFLVQAYKAYKQSSS